MSADGGIVIPARLTAVDLASRIDREPTEVCAVLAARGEPNSPEDFMAGDLAVAVARSLGATVTVEARDLALECLYELETKGELSSAPEGKAGTIVAGVTGTLDELDEMIESVSERWTVARMPVIDRNILRIGVHELINEPQTPTPVVVSEAVRLATTYSTEKSAMFVNGVLATLAKTTRKS
ncbi:MAG TPA: transcription antitermination factor NusB [Acidimicrobiia bacterium]|nr:transcription antitermination factor NusB [Acidimicrobiia bacterium]